MNELLKTLPLVAESASPVLISGENGTGKELVAQAIHLRSARREGPFVTVHCQAVPERRLEIELFGCARLDRLGSVARAEGGTLFIDEVSHLSPGQQVKLSRFLREGAYEPVGSERPARADARIIAATNQDLQALVENGGFRRDFYYRLVVVELSLPPLSRRREDIPLLARHFIGLLSVTTGKKISDISEEALEILSRHSFPGNVRELWNVMEHAFVLCAGPCIMPEHLPSGICNVLPASPHPLAAAEREAVVLALRRHGGNRTRAARGLGIHRSTLLRKMRRYGL